MKKPTIHPAGDHVLLKREPKEKVLASGIIIPTDVNPDGRAADVRKGEVLAVGPGRFAKNSNARIPMSVKPGDVVLFSPVFSGLESKKPTGCVLGDGELICRNGDIVCVVEES